MPTTPNASSSNPSSSTMYGFPNPGSAAGRSQFSQSFATPGSPASSSNVDDTFTRQMRDRQARGKDPYQSREGSDGGRESGSGTTLRLGSGRVEKEDFSRVERRQKAITFLDDPELLMMHAQSTGEHMMFRPISRIWDLVSSVNFQATQKSCIVGFGKTRLLRTELPIIVRLARLSCEARDFFYTALHKARLTEGKSSPSPQRLYGPYYWLIFFSVSSPSWALPWCFGYSVPGYCSTANIHYEVDEGGKSRMKTYK
ncbi:hypothetical protein F5144DRAFT_623090 [Chaetomium tenue]|uniref:Uncharacterized protein n=1 Tax=Chaetomium tenue TaxID=1854479 RepID=A0ACB7NX47_9PEZI|nr:hypothetical protein F5144DRAFT_623090 [Chaetomium globosum]